MVGSVVKSQLSGGQNSKNLPRFTDSRLTPTVLPLFLDVSLFHHLWQKSFGFSRWGALQGVQLQKILQNSEKLPEMSENPPTVEALACSPSYWCQPGFNQENSERWYKSEQGCVPHLSL